jgi:hypothetical protein
MGGSTLPASQRQTPEFPDRPRIAADVCIFSQTAYNARPGVNEKGWTPFRRASFHGIFRAWAAKPRAQNIPVNPETFLLTLALE